MAGKLMVHGNGKLVGPADLEYNSPFPCINGSWGSGAMNGVVIDDARARAHLAKVGLRYPVVDTDLPGGAKRLKQKAAGFRATIVGGQPLLIEQEHTGALPGRLLRA